MFWYVLYSWKIYFFTLKSYSNSYIYLITMIMFIRRKICPDVLTLSLLLWRRCILTCVSRLCSIKKWSPVCLFHCRFSYYIYLSGSRFKEAQEKRRKLSEDFRIQYLKGNLSFGCYVAFKKDRNEERWSITWKQTVLVLVKTLANYESFPISFSMVIHRSSLFERKNRVVIVNYNDVNSKSCTKC